MRVDQVNHLNGLEVEHARLKGAVTDLTFDRRILKKFAERKNELGAMATGKLPFQAPRIALSRRVRGNAPSRAAPPIELLSERVRLSWPTQCKRDVMATRATSRP